MNLDLAFVDSVSASPTVRLSLVTGPWSVLDGTRFDPPPLRYATSSTLLVDGETVSASAFGNRVINLVLRLDTDTEDEAATYVQALMRELNRPKNLLRYKPGTTHPVFFQTIRCAPDSVTFDAISKEVTVAIPAKPAAPGLKETLSQVTVNNDPAAGSNGMFLDVTGVKGDLETPLLLTIARTSLFSNALSSAYGVRRRGTPSSMPFVLQCESMTLGTGATLPGNDAAMSGSGSNYATISFGTNDLTTTRLSTTLFPGSASVDVRGTYRVFLRHRQTNGTDSFTVQLRYGASDDVPLLQFPTDAVTLTSSTNRRWTDLGLVSFPIGPDPVYDGYSGVELAVRGMSFSLHAQRLSGTQGLDMDVLLFVPADDRFGTIGWRTENLGIDNYVLDGVTDSVYALESTTQVRSLSGPLTRTAGAPLVSPGVTNRIVWMINAGPSNQTDSIGDTTAITPSYWPLYLYVKPLST